MHDRTRPLRIVFADPPRKEEPYPYHLPTMGILYLLGAIKRAFTPDQVSLTYLGANETLESHLQRVDELQPDLYGLSFKTQMTRSAYRTLNAVKARFPHLPVITGGQHVSAMPNEVMERTTVDACFRGECEETILTLIERFDGRLHCEHIPGAVFRDGDHIVANPVAPMKAKIDELSWPAWDMVDARVFPGMPYKRGYPYLGVLISRGCPFQCTFCSEPVWKIHGRPTFRARTPEDIVREVEHVYTTKGVKELRLLCEEFNVNEKWCCEVLDRIIALGHKDLYLNFNIRGDVMSDRLATTMRAANVWMVNMGIETVSNRTLEGVKKRVTVEEIEETCRILTNHDIRVMGYFQFFLAWEENGVLCWETAEDARRTLRWALSLYKKGLIHYMNTAVASPRPATPLYDLAVKHNLFKSDPDDPFPYLTEGLRLPGLSTYDVAQTMLWADYVKLRVAVGSGDLNWPLAKETAARHIRRGAARFRGKAAA